MNSMKSMHVAFLIDADNVSIDVIQQAFELVQMRHDVIHIRRAHCTPESAAKHVNTFKRLSIRPIVNVSTGKNSTDIALAVDAMDLVQSEHPDIVYIVSSDSDFAPLVIRLREKGCRVEGIGQKGKTGEESTIVYDDFVDIEHRKSAAGPTRQQVPASSQRPMPAKRGRRGGRGDGWVDGRSDGRSDGRAENRADADRADTSSPGASLFAGNAPRHNAPMTTTPNEPAAEPRRGRGRGRNSRAPLTTQPVPRILAQDAWPFVADDTWSASDAASFDEKFQAASEPVEVIVEPLAIDHEASDGMPVPELDIEAFDQPSSVADAAPARRGGTGRTRIPRSARSDRQRAQAVAAPLEAAAETEPMPATPALVAPEVAPAEPPTQPARRAAKTSRKTPPKTPPKRARGAAAKAAALASVDVPAPVVEASALAPEPAAAVVVAPAESLDISAWPHLPEEIARILATVPALASGDPVELNVAGERLRAAGLLAKSAPSTRLFGKHPDFFVLTPIRQPNKVRFQPADER